MSAIRNKAVGLTIFFLLLGALCIFSSEIVKADVVVNNNDDLKLTTTNFTTTNVIKVPDRGKARRENAEREAMIRASRGLSTASKYSDQGTVSGSGASIIEYAKQFMGRPYIWGAEGPYSFDCSGFTQYVYKHFGVYLPHYTGYQVKEGVAVAKQDLKAGDVVFFHTYESFSHVGLYIGGGKFIHASSGSMKVTISDLNSSYYQQHYAGARRMVD